LQEKLIEYENNSEYKYKKYGLKDAYSSMILRSLLMEGYAKEFISEPRESFQTNTAI